MKIDESVIYYGDVCYAPRKVGSEEFYGYAQVTHVTEDCVGLETEIGGYMSLSAQEMKDRDIDFVHKEEWVRVNNKYFKQEGKNENV